MRRIFNFSPGPAILPVPVLEEASRAVLEINDSGMSILEVSHRGKVYDAIHAETQANILQVLGLSSDDAGVRYVTPRLPPHAAVATCARTASGRAP